MLFSETQRAAMKAAGKRVAIFLRLNTPEKVRMWTGVGDFKLPADGIETTEGAIYRGVGMVDLAALDLAINGKASRIEVGFSGVDQEIAELADSEAPLVKGRSVHIGLVPLGADWQPVGDVKWLWRGTADVPRSRRTGAGGEVRYTVSIGVGSAFIWRRQPRPMFYTPTDQALDAGSDKGFDNVAALNEGLEKKWPRG